jgi:hypothetical protein
MPEPVKLSMSPAEEQRMHKARVRREIVCAEELQAAAALVDLIESDGLRRDMPAMSPKRLQQLFHFEDDRHIIQGVTGRVLTRVGVFPHETKNTVQIYQVLDAKEALERVALELRADMQELRRQLGRE